MAAADDDGPRGGGAGRRSKDNHNSSKKRHKPKQPKRPRFLILDFRRVTAVDMSSVVNCWLPLQSLCRDLGVVLVYAHCNLRVEFYLRANRLIDDTNTRLLPTLHQALDFCETALLQVGKWLGVGVCFGGWLVGWLGWVRYSCGGDEE